MNSRISRGCYATLMYPQVVMLLLQMFNTYSAWWCPAITGGYRSSGPMKSQLIDSKGNSYVSVAGVWQEQLAFLEIYDYLIEQLGNSSKRYVVQHLKVRECLTLYNRIETAIANESKGLFFYFRIGSAFRFCRTPIKSIGYIFNFFILRLISTFATFHK
jgi:hypothetical protein